MVSQVSIFLLVVSMALSLALAKNSINVVGYEAPRAVPEYQVGVAKADVTGPAAQVGMMGYAMPGQTTAGIHLRQWARAYVFYYPANGTIVAVVNTDLCMIMQAVKLTVIARLAGIFGPHLFTNDNVLLTGTHTHSGAGGFSWYILYDISDFGYDAQNFDAAVSGIVTAIVNAHANLKPADIFIETDSMLLESNINRSPTAYLANPEEERARYPEGNTDKNMTLLKMVDTNGDAFAALTWFAVHGTSMNNTNHLISSDNKGYAEYSFERYMVGNSSSILYKDIPFVAAFAQSNEGDVSPNTRGPHCPDGSPCANDSTCNGKNEQCIASGPGANMFESTKIIGTYQFEHAIGMFNSANELLSGPIAYRHLFVNMTDIIVSGNFTHDGQPGRTCRGAMGYSFAAGTTDGPGAFDFTQGDNNTNGNPFWNFVSSFLAKPTQDQIECQAPKPILIDVGQIEPIPWAPDVVAVQIVSIGQLVLLAVPGEFTTMSGRRLRNTVREVLIQSGMQDPIVVIAGLSNTYSGYIATYEEYQVQRYEAASTVFGPHTLGAYQQLFAQLAESLVTGAPLPASAVPRNLSADQISFHLPVIVDTVPIGKSFGSISQDVQPSYQIGEEVSVVFHGANPRNNLMTGESFLFVEQLNPSTNNWTTILTDADWDTKFEWESHLISESLITVAWNLSSSTEPGKYRITHEGYAKKDPFTDKLTFYTGTSSVFAVLSA